MECQEFRKCIPEFAAGKLKYKQAEEGLDHVRSCAACRDELEIYCIVEYGIKKDAALEGPFILKDIVEDCFDRVKRGINFGRGKQIAFLGLRILFYVLVFMGVLAVMARIL